MEMNSTVRVPTGVRVLATLNYISAGLAIIAILAIIVMGSSMPILGVVGVVVAIPLLIGVVLNIAIGRALFRAKNWARILLIIFGCIGIIAALVQFKTTSIIPVAINILITGYLLFNKNVKAAFTSPVTDAISPTQTTG